MVGDILTDGSFLGAVLAITVGAIVTLGKVIYDSLQEQRRMRRRLEGDERDETQDGFLVETEKSFDHIEERLDKHDDRFNSIDGKLDRIADAVKQNGHHSPEIKPHDRDRWEGNSQGESDGEKQ